MNNKKILGVDFSHFCSDNTTVSVSALDNEDREQTFHVQTDNGKYTTERGCMIFAQGEDEDNVPAFDIDEEDYPSFDLEDVAKAAEEFLRSEVEVEETDYEFTGNPIHLVMSNYSVSVVYKTGRGYSDPIEIFDTRDEAVEYLESNTDMKRIKHEEFIR